MPATLAPISFQVAYVALMQHTSRPGTLQLLLILFSQWKWTKRGRFGGSVSRSTAGERASLLWLAQFRSAQRRWWRMGWGQYVYPHAVNDDLLLKIPRPHVRSRRREGGDALSAPDALCFPTQTLRTLPANSCPTQQVNACECDKTVYTKAPCPPTPPPPGSR